MFGVMTGFIAECFSPNGPKVGGGVPDIHITVLL
jgi:hypothetical protein